MIIKLEFIGQLLRTIRHVILSGARSAESKNLCIMMTFVVKSGRRSFDFAVLCTASLRMTNLGDGSIN